MSRRNLTVLAMLAVALLLFYGGARIMVNHETWFEAGPDQPVVQGRFEDRALLVDSDKNQDAIVEECRRRFSIKQKFRHTAWKDGHFIVHFANLRGSTDVEIVPQDGRLNIRPGRLSLARILKGLQGSDPP